MFPRSGPALVPCPLQHERERFCPSLSTCLFFFSSPSVGKGEQKAPPGRRKALPRVRPAQDSQISRGRIRAGGRGAGQSVPAWGSLTWRGQRSSGPCGAAPAPLELSRSRAVPGRGGEGEPLGKGRSLSNSLKISGRIPREERGRVRFSPSNGP